jgi:hypothetical protein
MPFSGPCRTFLKKKKGEPKSEKNVEKRKRNRNPAVMLFVKKTEKN